MAEKIHPFELTDENFDQEALSASIPVLVDCWAPWCPPCLVLGPVIEELASEYNGRIKVCKLNVDENPNVARQYAIRSIPTLILLKNGEAVDQMVGALPKEQLSTHLDKVL